MSTRQYKFKLVLESGKFVYSIGEDEDAAVGNFVLSGGDPDEIVDVIPCFSPTKRQRYEWDD